MFRLQLPSIRPSDVYIFPASVECSRLEMKMNRMQSPVQHLQNRTQRFHDVGHPASQAISAHSRYGSVIYDPTCLKLENLS